MYFICLELLTMTEVEAVILTAATLLNTYIYTHVLHLHRVTYSNRVEDVKITSASLL